MSAPSAHPFAGYVKLLGRGKTARRSLTEPEAEEAFGMILDGLATDAQLGAFLMLLRVKEETSAEIAGMVRAARNRCHAPESDLRVDLDWPSYSGKRQHHPWYLLSALLLGSGGFRVVMHGCAAHAADRLFAEDVLPLLGVFPAASWSDASQQLDTRGFAYLALNAISPRLQQLLDRRAEFGLRSPVNTLVRHLDPAQARSGLRSLHHPAYAALHVDAAVSLGNEGIAVFRGEGGECELRPDADTPLALLRDGEVQHITLSRVQPQRSPKPEHPSGAALRALWEETVHCSYGIDAVLGTTAVALLALGHARDVDGARHEALRLWQQRPSLPGAQP